VGEAEKRIRELFADAEKVTFLACQMVFLLLFVLGSGRK
jgi:hypothetical protein